MKIIIELSQEEATRIIQDDNSYLRRSYELLIRKIENICTEYQIRYIDIYHTGE